MRRDFTTRRRSILGSLIFLLLADVALATYSWLLASEMQTPREQAVRQALRLKLLQTNIADSQKIRNDTPNTQKDCEKFEQSLLPASTGDFSVSSEIGAVAKKTGVRLESLSFKRTAIPERGVTEVGIESIIDGDYRSVIPFLNGLQRSASIYVIESLTLAPERSSQGSSNLIKLGLHLKTYFRTGA